MSSCRPSPKATQVPEFLTQIKPIAQKPVVAVKKKGGWLKWMIIIWAIILVLVVIGVGVWYWFGNTAA